jgi:hypothetical protein
MLLAVYIQSKSHHILVHMLLLALFLHHFSYACLKLCSTKQERLIQFDNLFEKHKPIDE